ncbi:response regulator [Deinococcus deserti]|uniref:Putative response regulator, CheY n=1 Tax=Deinococcus deserti (strain DSM 17065 / CIP 109153 / LMG 22923 / VCD115) TaxID=546414 RepID=C1D287_DEIDV|nr:response regulator [Deinococcus deserti]ACO47526.1 putative response regulator, CheY [Deinococcus deserti VCD115]
MPAPCNYLLIGDSPTERLLAEEAFEQVCPECSLTTSASGAEALELLQNETFQPNVILLDVNMPEMNGFQLLAELKRDPRLQKIPVVMLTTSNAKSDIIRAYSLHASSYLVKSSEFDGFLEQVEVFLQYWQANRVAHSVSGCLS